MNQCPKTIYDAAQYWRSKGLDPLPIPNVDGHPTKNPTQSGWPIAAANGHSDKDFQRPCNLGNLLGGATNAVDVDADSAIAVTIANEILPKEFEKTLVFGRASKRCSHHIYFGDEPILSEEIRDPIDDEMIIELRSLNKDGTRGRQTVFPPSRHYEPKTGIEEQIEIEPNSASEIATVPSAKLGRAVRWIGAAALLAKHFPATSNRHNTILALAGIFARAQKHKDAARDFILCTYRHSAGFNRDTAKVTGDIRGVFKGLDSSRDTNLYGYPKLIEIIPQKVVDKVIELLNIERPEAAYPLTDSGNARWLIDTYRDELRFCADAKVWFRYDGVRWVEGEMAIRELAKFHALSETRATISRIRSKIAISPPLTCAISIHDPSSTVSSSQPSPRQSTGGVALARRC